MFEDPEVRYARKEPQRVRLAALQSDVRSRARAWAEAVEKGDLEVVLKTGMGEEAL